MGTTDCKIIDQLFAGQLAGWDLARQNYMALSQVQIREVTVGGTAYKLQFNPTRIVSSAAKVDKRSIQERKCFLCPENLPEVQRGIPCCKHYQILVNPFPIFPKHLTIPDVKHVPQRIAGRFEDLLVLSQLLTAYTLFYNGPRCGASAPDHAHFQAGYKGFMPIEQQWISLPKKEVIAEKNASLYCLEDRLRTAFILTASDIKSACSVFNALYHALPEGADDDEPMMNILASYEDNRWTIIVFPRAKHRPDCYYAQDGLRLLSSPAAVDLGGVFIMPIADDFRRVSDEDIARILSEVCLPYEKMQQVCHTVKQTFISNPI